MSATAVLPTTSSVHGRIARFVLIGWISTGVYWALFLTMRMALTATWATLIALTISTLANTAAQRHFTFAAAEGTSAHRDHLMSLAVFGASWLLSIQAIELLHTWVTDAPAVTELAVAQGCTLVGSAVRFALLQTWNRP